jgi:hypothetical protein
MIELGLDSVALVLLSSMRIWNTLGGIFGMHDASHQGLAPRQHSS